MPELSKRKYGGCREAVVDKETGYLVPRGDIETLKTCLQKLIDNPGLRQQMGTAGHQRFLENFTANRMVSQTMALYQDVIHRFPND